MSGPSSIGRSADDELRDEGGRRLGLVAATKKENPFELHGSRVAGGCSGGLQGPRRVSS